MTVLLLITINILLCERWAAMPLPTSQGILNCPEDHKMSSEILKDWVVY